MSAKVINPGAIKTSKQLEEEAKYKLVRDNGNKQTGYHFTTEEQLSAYKEALCREQRELCAKHGIIEQCITDEDGEEWVSDSVSKSAILNAPMPD